METIISAVDPLLLLSILVGFLCFLIYGRQKPVNYPPGPWGLPIVGNLLQLGSSPHIALTKLSKVYGDVFSVSFGSREAVVLNSGEVVREALLQRYRHFSSRPPLFALNVLGVRKFSIAFGEYCPKQIQRKRRALRAIHEIVFSNVDYFNKIVQDVFLDFKEGLVKEGTNTFQPSIQLKLAVIKIMFNFTFGENSCNHLLSEELQKIVVESTEFTESSAACSLVDFVPWLKPFVRKQIAVVEHSVEEMMNFVHKVYTTRKYYHEKDSCISKCVARLLEKETRKSSEEMEMPFELNEKSDPFHPGPKGKAVNIGDQEMVKMLSADIFGAGLETVSNALCWAMAYMVNNPNIQEDLHRELDSTVGPHRLPTIQDKPNMPLLQATVMEVLRISSVLPLALPHATSDDTSLGRYKIPRNTLVVVNLWAVNHDSRVFKNPHVFNPYRFLDDNGDICETKSKLLPFSIGSRRCLGSTLAKAELFLFLACLLQNFELSSSTAGNVDLEGRFGLTLSPKPFSVCAVLR